MMSHPSLVEVYKVVCLYFCSGSTLKGLILTPCFNNGPHHDTINVRQTGFKHVHWWTQTPSHSVPWDGVSTDKTTRMLAADGIVEMHSKALEKATE